MLAWPQVTRPANGDPQHPAPDSARNKSGLPGFWRSAVATECLEFVRTYRETIALTHRRDTIPERDMPPRLREKLDEFIEQNPDLR
ncbi:hypothetical protein HQ590_15890 [bacterium]|nr:hypothetical protein [bacterium]